ncbi:MAG: enoyl-CoA hydratase/isomerase family protein, partial [Acidobacteria bacterium]|nr:enoyl-CoA hydratase/isomerase family protein [Acidobacteriota bacterium]
LHVMSKDGYSIEEADLLTGPVLGRPRTATFRTADLVGLDTFLHVCRNLYENLPLDEYRELFQPPPVLTELVSRGWLGDKSGQGFYRRAKGGEGSALLALDLKTLEYRPAEKPKFASLEMTRGIEDVDERLRALVFQEDRAGQFLWPVLSETLVYAANRIPEIADSIVDVDRALRWGFNWERGPFEIWDALDARKVVERLEKEDRPVPPLALHLLRAGKKSFYERREGARYFFSPAASGYEAVAQPAGVVVLDELRHQGRVVRKNAGASLLDLGNGVACLEFHSKMNAIGGDTIEMLRAAVEMVDKEFEGLVVGNQGPHFSAGANLMLLLLEAQEGNWDEIDFMVGAFQGGNTSLRYFQKPVVAAPFGMTLGGGCEVSLHCHRLQASAEVYMGLVEVGVGLIPAGGGTKEMLARAMEADAVRWDPSADLLPYLKHVFETIGMAKVSSSAAEARELGFLREEDGITFNPDRLIADAKQAVLAMAPAFRPPQPRREIPVMGETALAALKLALHLMKRAGYITEYDEVIGLKLAHVLAGGNLHAPRRVSEQYLLDLEREAFLSLIGQRKTHERMQHMLKTGKTLRN